MVPDCIGVVRYCEVVMDIEATARYWRDRPGGISGALHSIQEELGYLEEETVKRLAAALEVPLSRVYGVATFFAAFRLKPVGRIHIQVCHGTACHVRGARQLSEKLQRDLRVVGGEVRADGTYSLEEVRCLGCCGLAPVLRVNDTIYGRVRQDQLDELFGRFEDDDDSAIPSGS